MQKVVVPVVGALLPPRHPRLRRRLADRRASGEYVLGGFWPTWALSAVIIAAAPLSYPPSLGDYPRRISAHRGDNRRSCAPALGVSSSAACCAHVWRVHRDVA